MGKARAIRIDSRNFEKAGDATAFFSAMLSRYGINNQVNDVDAIDLAALVKRHDEAGEKVGSGIAHFVVANAPEPYTTQRCFWIVRSDGSRTDFSYQHCLEKKPYD